MSADKNTDGIVWVDDPEQAREVMVASEWRRLPGVAIPPENLAEFERRVTEAFAPAVETVCRWQEQAREAIAAWCRLAGLIDSPPEPQPRPWKVHQSRFRQRSRR